MTGYIDFQTVQFADFELLKTYSKVKIDPSCLFLLTLGRLQ